MKNTLDDAINKVAMCLRDAQLYLMPSVLNNLQNAMREEKDELALAKLMLIGADVARTCGQSVTAAVLTENILAKPPSRAMHILSAAKRLRVSLYLDEANINPALSLADTIDALEIESAAYLKKDVSMVVMSKNDEFVEVETWLTLAEVHCSMLATEKATLCLQNARKRLYRDEETVACISMTISERSKAKSRISDCRQHIEFWESMARLVNGEPPARELLGGLRNTVQLNPKHDKRLVARISAVLGEWLYDQQVAPTGICLAEANRLFSLGLPSPQGFELIQAIDAGGEPLADHRELTGGQSVELGNNLTQALLTTQIETSKQISDLTKVCRDLIEKDKNPAHLPVAETVSKSRSLEGGLDKIILPALLELALEFNFTGYFDMTWEADDIESSVKAKLISQRASIGHGFIFIQNRNIIDATLGTYETPSGKENDADDANEAISIMLQLSMGVGLDTIPVGNVFFRHSPSVATRPARILLVKDQVIDFVIKLDEKVQFPERFETSDEELADNFDADWGMPAGSSALPPAVPLEPELELSSPPPPVGELSDDNILTF